MAYKKKTNNKAEKATVENKASKPAAKKQAAIDWSSLPAEVMIVGKQGRHLSEGQEYKVTKEIAEILINNGKASLK